MRNRLRRSWILIAGLLFAACGGESVKVDSLPDMQACTGSCGGDVYVLDRISLVSTDDDGFTKGWNLDGLTTEGPLEDGCYKSDYTSADGVTGIDNQVAMLLESAGTEIAAALPLLIQNAIKEGGILLLAEMVGGDSPVDDDLLGLAFRRGVGRPMLGTDDAMLPDQTFTLHAEPWLGGYEPATLSKGMLEGGPFDLRLPIVVFGIFYEITLRDARLSLTVSPDGREISGHVGGGIPVSDILTVGDTIVVPELGALVKALAPSLADLRNEETGECDRISAVAEFHGIPAFIYEEN